MDHDETFVISGPLVAETIPFVGIYGNQPVRGALITIGAQCPEHGFEPVLEHLVSLS